MKGNSLKDMETQSEDIKLPEPRYDSEISIEEALLRRRSVRSYEDKPLTIKDVSQLLWSAQGITDKVQNLRTAPSAGALYPLEVYAIVSQVDDLQSAVYRYEPLNHKLTKVMAGDRKMDIYNASLQQSAIQDAVLIILITAVYERTTVKYGERGIRYVYMEAGHCAQNVYLQAVSLNLGTVVIGAFYDDKVKKAMNLDENEHPLYIIPVGRR